MKHAIAVCGTAAILAGAGIAIPAPAGAATPMARVKVYASDDGWHDPSVRPGAIYVGNGNAPRVLRIRWARWGTGSARGSGKFYPGDRAAVVTLSGVREHGSTDYFRVMTWKRGSRVTARWAFRSGWWEPACFPLTSGGSCYEPGEYCRKADHGASGVAGDGKAIKCEDNDGWRWEAS